MQIDPLPEIGDVLRGLVGNAGHIVLVNQHGGGAAGVRRDFLDINDRAVGDTSDRIQPGPAFALEVARGFGFAAQQGITGNGHANRAQRKSVETKRNHWQSET